MDSIDLLLHPVRLRIVHAMHGEPSRTTAELCERLGDVPKTSVYRHVGLLARAGVLEVTEEQRVHGAVERHYRLRRDRSLIDDTAAASMSHDDHRRGFAAAMAVLLAEFNAYLDQDGADPVADGIGYRQRPLWLSDTERSELTGRLGALLAEYAHHRPADDREQYMLSPILFPVKRTGTSA